MDEREAQALVQQVRTGDYDRFLAIQLAPPNKRLALYALTAFHIELARIAEIVSEPMIGHIRLAWWREALEQIEAQEPSRNHPVVRALAEIYPQSPEAFFWLHTMVDARAADLDTSLIATEEAWRDYCANTAGALHMAFAHVLDDATAKTHGQDVRQQAQAFAMIGLARAIPFMAAQGWLRLPQVRLDAHGVVSLAPSATLPALVNALVADALAVLPTGGLPRALKPLQGLSLIAAHHAKKLQKACYDPYRLKQSKLLIVIGLYLLNIM